MSSSSIKLTSSSSNAGDVLYYIKNYICLLSFEVGYNEGQGQQSKRQEEAEMPTKKTAAAPVEIVGPHEDEPPTPPDNSAEPDIHSDIHSH